MMNPKKTKRLACTMACLLLAVLLSFTGCSTVAAVNSTSSASVSSETVSSEEPTPAPTAEPEEESTEEESSESGGLFASVSEYLADPDVAAQIDSQISSLEGTGLQVEVYADGSTLVYEYTYGEQLDLSDEATKQSMIDALASGCEEQSATFKNIAVMLRSVISADDIKVRLIYNNADGSEIYSCEFE